MIETDQEIVKEVLEGETRAFNRLIDRHKAKAMTLAIRILRNREDAEEALQDAFVRVYRSLFSFEWKSSFSTWLYRIVYNTCMTAAKKKDENIEYSLDDNYDENIRREQWSDELTPDIQFQSDEFKLIIQEEIEKLPAAYGGTFTLFVIQEMSYDEIMHVTNLPLGTIKARIFRARALLRNSIAKRLNDACIVKDQEGS